MRRWSMRATREGHSRQPPYWIALIALTGCSISDREYALVFVASLLLLVPVAALLNYCLYRLWRGRRELMPASGIEAGIAFAATVSVATPVFFARTINEYTVVFCLVLVASSYFTLFSIGIGLALILKSRWAFRVLYWLPALAITLMAAPAALQLGLDRRLEEVPIALVGFGGGLGTVGWPLLLLLVLFSLLTWDPDRERINP